MQTKVCQTCNQEKTIDKFHKHKGRQFDVTAVCAQCRNQHMVLKRHGITQELLDAMLFAQNYVCAICFKPQTNPPMALAVDHCHETGAIRGLLCGNCNHALGKLKDSIELLESAIRYLKMSHNNQPKDTK